MNDREKEEWRKKALHCSRRIHKHALLKNFHLQIIEYCGKELGKLGHEAGGLVIEGSTFYVFGIYSAKTFFKNLDLSQNFFLHTRQPSSNTSDNDLKELKSKVSQLFNTKYSEAVGKAGQRMLYKSFEKWCRKSSWAY